MGARVIGIVGMSGALSLPSGGVTLAAAAAAQPTTALPQEDTGKRMLDRVVAAAPHLASSALSFDVVDTPPAPPRPRSAAAPGSVDETSHASIASSHARATPPSPSSAPAAAARTTQSCAPPYVIEPVTGHKHWKIDCL